MAQQNVKLLNKNTIGSTELKQFNLIMNGSAYFQTD
jgi:hypothetical protein